MKKVVFDVDDILWSLNEKASDDAGVDRNNIVTYNPRRNPLLSDEEKHRLIKSYTNPTLFENIKWYDGISRINTLKADVSINSNALSAGAAESKRTQLKQVLTLPDDKIQINIVEQGKGKKSIGEDVYIFVDDCPDNVLNSRATYNIMMKCPWNTSESEIDRLRSHDRPIIMCESLNTIINVIEILLNDDSDIKKKIDEIAIN